MNNNHLEQWQINSLKLHYEVGEMLDEDILKEILNHLDNCRVCRIKYDLEKPENKLEKFEIDKIAYSNADELTKMIEIMEFLKKDEKRYEEANALNKKLFNIDGDDILSEMKAQKEESDSIIKFIEKIKKK